MSTNPPGDKVPISDLNNVLMTGKALDKTITQELEFPDLADLLVSAGTSDSYTTPFDSLKNELVVANEMQIPPYIRSKTDVTRSRVFVGILKEVGRAWMSLDNRLYIWDYTTGGDISEYADQDQLICSVGIVKPKAGAFDTHIEYLLIVATALQIIPIGLSLTKPTQLGEQSVLTMIAVNLAVPSDDITMSSIVGTDDGRLFLVGHPTMDQSNVTGDVYELTYTSSTKWSNGSGELICRTQKMINRFLPTPFRVKTEANVKNVYVDNERKLLYILTFNSNVEVVNIAGYGYSSILKHKTIIDHVQQMCRQQQRIYNREEFIITSLHVISKEESRKICLMAMTAGGFRLFFTGHPNALRPFSMDNMQNDTPTTLELAHVRLPPPEINLNLEGPRPRYHTTFYNRGTCISTKANEEHDDIYITALASVQPDKQSNTLSYGYTSANSVPFIETAASKSTEYRFAVIEEIANGTKQRELSQQLSDPQRRFLAASTNSLCVYSKLRPVDMLERFVRQYHPSNKERKKEMIAFFEEFGVSEACAMCLSIICDSGDKQVAETATQIFFEYGGAPSAAKPNQTPGNYLGRANTVTGITYSGKHDGFALYLSRLLGPVWSLKLFVPSCSNEASVPFTVAKQKLNKLKTFMDMHRGFHDPAHISDARFRSLDSSMLSLYLDEQKSMHELYLFLLQCIDSTEFAVFLLDAYTGNHIQRYMSVDKPSLIKDIDVKMMLTSPEGREFCHELVITKIDETAVNSPTTGSSVTDNLQSRCPIFFSPGEYFFFRGVELIRQALCEELENERRHLLKQSLLQFQQASEKIPEPHLERVCALYLQQSFHIGIVELMLDRARKLDPQQHALAVFESDCQADDLSKQLFESRSRAYNFIFKTLKDAKSLLLPNANLENRAPVADKTLYVKQVFEEALQNKDPLFHYQLYYWYIQENMMDELLLVDTEYLIPFFTRVIKDERTSLEFLWQYYRGKSQFYKSACCLASLAELSSSEITLESRMKYLAYARINCRCGEQEPDTPSHATSQLSQKLDNLMNACRFQARIQNVLKNTGDLDANVVAKELDHQLIDEKRKLYPLTERFPVLLELFES
ncbi:hypothetical protein G6F46_009697 [Rhizopus delemar]|uniref:Nucleoporin Nup133/Nup155-like N-terminal domain-containing protein n=2 Tax=Rhizopus TaxID=4842 RepID=A0A9P6YWG9_9FUNG|nr:hypothetical protein G6F55_008675 [Rhizopus delemar]KAG1538400.1 hypothetical protein G6F51_009793 [Rhizopus arrhizus]KAG1492568.1 hypothetical protein G6F54_009218 [Rhizopus delemar]KAG1506696.1 hypothetical protein G6F53_009503 [Rhizopus delemar]KAG1521915.1 hypothetical protein G6F52_006315 [Rhizopus delemar]